MNPVFDKHIGKTIEVYNDDILVKSLEEKDHLAYLQKTIVMLMKYNINLNLKSVPCGRVLENSLVFSSLKEE